MNINERIKKILYDYKDERYKNFNQKLLPDISADTIIGVRVPILRTVSKQLASDAEIDIFLSTLPHEYYEENNIHGYIIEQIKDFDKCISAICEFLPYIDNWATCDTIRPKCFKGNEQKLFSHIENWLHSKHTYTIRYAIGLFLSYYLDKHFSVTHNEMVCSIISEEYYVNMMIAWYFATALSKQYDKTIPYLANRKLPSKWVHNKTIQKAIESYRISDEKKEIIKSLRL